jgi:hypothetical protein
LRLCYLGAAGFDSDSGSADSTVNPAVPNPLAYFGGVLKFPIDFPPAKKAVGIAVVVLITQDAARNILDQHFSHPKATRLLGLLRRLETGTMDDLSKGASRSSYYAGKKVLKALGLWPPSATQVELAGLRLPPLEELLSDRIVAVSKTHSDSPVATCGDSSAEVAKAA